MVKNLRKNIFVFVFCLTGFLNLKGQDQQYTQFYANPVYLNPGFAGTSIQSRAAAVYRNQWPSLPKAFVSYNFSYDQFIPSINSGIGITIQHDKAGTGGLTYTSAAINYAYEIQIWSDVDGFHNNDPRFVKDAHPVRHMSYDEAAELTYFGAKIMHPSSVVPARNASIPIKLKNTLNPSDKGTVIHGFARPNSIRAIAAKDGITVISIKSGRMLNAYGFLRRLFGVFEDHQVPIDVITTSEVAVSVTIESSQLKEDLIADLGLLGEIQVFRNQSVICVVGDFGAEKEAMALSVLGALNTIPIRMISYGGSEINVTLVVNREDKIEAINSLHNNLLQKNDGKQELVEAV